MKKIQEKKITVLGSTGSVGTQTLDVARHNNITVEGISGASNIRLLEEQIREFKPCFCAVKDENAALELKLKVADTDCVIISGEAAAETLAAMGDSDTVINAITGIAGLKPSLSAIKAKKTLALANKETIVTAGKIVIDEAKNNNVRILPVDSEHSALFQCLGEDGYKFVDRLILTASGGPFLSKNRQELENITVEDALAHPTWSMGAKITIDSATLMNKGFEVIEAVYLFDVSPKKVEVLIHPQSIVHSMVEYIDKATIAQLSVPDMRLCIQYALSYPDRTKGPLKKLDLTAIGSLTFGKPDMKTFKLLELAYEVAQKEGVLGAVLNGANERAVELFLNRNISFTDITDMVCEVVRGYKNIINPTLDDIFTADLHSRELIDKMIRS